LRFTCGPREYLPGCAAFYRSGTPVGTEGITLRMVERSRTTQDIPKRKRRETIGAGPSRIFARRQAPANEPV